MSDIVFDNKFSRILPLSSIIKYTEPDFVHLDVGMLLLVEAYGCEHL